MPNFGDDDFQFTRLLAELYAAGIPQETIDQAAASMDLEPAEVQEILARADRDFERMKDSLGWSMTTQARDAAAKEEEESVIDEQVDRHCGQRWSD